MIFTCGCEEWEVPKLNFLLRHRNISLLPQLCHSSPVFLERGRSAESLLQCPTTHPDSIISPSILYYPLSDFTVFYPFNSIPTSGGCRWGEGASSDLWDWLCYLSTGAAAAPFLPHCSPASAPAWGVLGGILDHQKETGECHRQGLILRCAQVVVYCPSVLVILLPARSSTSSCTSFRGEGDVKGRSQSLQNGCVGSTVFRISTVFSLPCYSFACPSSLNLPNDVCTVILVSIIFHFTIFTIYYSHSNR